MLGILLGTLGTFILAVWGKGAEVQCGIGTVSKICYEQGITWTSELCVVVGIFSIVAILLLQDTDRVE